MCMVGIVTVDDAMLVLQEEETEDISRMAGVNPNDDSYFGTTVFEHVKSRLPWLLFLMLSATVTQMIMELQQEIAFEKAQETVGSTLSVMVEGRLPDEHAYVARSYKDAPNVDGFVFIQTSRELMTGDLVRVRITGAHEYDLIGEIEDEFTK